MSLDPSATAFEISARVQSEAVGSVTPVGSVGSNEAPLDRVRAWFARFVLTVHEDDLDILALWAVHTHVAESVYTTPRLVLDSPVPGAGKTTVLEHMVRLCAAPLQAASLSSPALLARTLANGPRTILIDEVDRNLDPKRDGVGELIAVINAGYKVGATRPTLVPRKDGWEAVELPTFAPVAMAGNAPSLPEDTWSRCIRVLLLPDRDGRVDESDWEEIDPDAKALGETVQQWCEQHRADIVEARPVLPDDCRGRMKEKWRPLARVAAAAGGSWPERVTRLIERDIAGAKADEEDGAQVLPAPVTLLRNIAEIWTAGAVFMPTNTILTALIDSHPDTWGAGSPFGKPLTQQRMGRMLVKSFKVNSSRQGDGPRGYFAAEIAGRCRRLGLKPPSFRTDGTDGTDPTDGGAQ